MYNGVGSEGDGARVIPMIIIQGEGGWVDLVVGRMKAEWISAVGDDGRSVLVAQNHFPTKTF
jgi:hypothetical protein